MMELLNRPDVAFAGGVMLGAITGTGWAYFSRWRRLRAARRSADNARFEVEVEHQMSPLWRESFHRDEPPPYRRLH